MNLSPPPEERIRIGGIEIGFVFHRHPVGRFTVVLLHGFGASHASWIDVFPILAQQYSVLAVDLKGAGTSDAPADGRYAPSDHAATFLELMNRLCPEQPILVGHSFGGGILFLCLPEILKVAGMAQGLILIDSAGYAQQLRS